MEKTKVAIVGMGNVGSGVARLLLDHGDRTARHAGRTLWLERAVVRDIRKSRDADIPDGVLTDQLDAVTLDPDIRVVAQLIGGIEPARTIMIDLLKSGKDVVTANKALLAEHGPELFDLARKLGRCIVFEASVAGGIPIITNLSQCLNANQIDQLTGILNGTSNYVLTEMCENGMSYQQALANAQDLGFAEPDPSLDVDGTDAAQKLSILAHLAFGTRTHWSQIQRRGIDDINLVDVHYAQQLGFQIKHIASARRTDHGVELAVGPEFIAKGKPLAEVRANFNAITVSGDAVGPLLYHGQGAGRMPTASAVVADMIDTAVGRAPITFRTLKLWDKDQFKVDMVDHSQTAGRYYLRFQIDSRPSVLTRIISSLEQNQVEIESIVQHEKDRCEKSDSVPLIVMTRRVQNGQLAMAIQAIRLMSDAVFEIEQFKVTG